MPDQKNDVTIERVEQNDTSITVKGNKRLDACGDRVEDVQLTGLIFCLQAMTKMAV